MANQYSKSKIKDMNLLGKRFTRLSVIADGGFHPHGEHLWKCRCDCGKIRKVAAEALIHGRTKSCGCYQRDRTRELFSLPIEELTVSRVLVDYRKRSREKELKFRLSREQLGKIINSDCYYCGVKPSNNLNYHGKKLVYQGIDRLDNTKGYTPDNVVPCCIICNKMKKTMSHDEFLQHIQKIAEKHCSTDYLQAVSPGEDIYGHAF